MPSGIAQAVAPAGSGPRGIEPVLERRRQADLLVPEQRGADRHQGNVGSLGRGPAGREDLVANHAVNSQLLKQLRQEFQHPLGFPGEPSPHAHAGGRPNRGECQPSRHGRHDSNVLHVERMEGKSLLLGERGGLFAGDQRDFMPAAHQFDSDGADGKQMTGVFRADERRNGPWSVSSSFVAEGVDGVQPRRLPGGVITEDDAHGHRDGHGDHRGVPARPGWASPPWRSTNTELALPTRMPMNPPTRHSTTASMRNWMQDVGRVGAHGHPQADLAGPLGDGDEHDVHDAHAAHHQRNGGHRHAQAGEHADHASSGRWRPRRCRRCGNRLRPRARGAGRAGAG